MPEKALSGHPRTFRFRRIYARNARQAVVIGRARFPRCSTIERFLGKTLLLRQTGIAAGVLSVDWILRGEGN
jgi:hypothetical protein